MSKNALNQIAPAELVDDFGVDPVRYHLLREVPFGADGDFSYEGLIDRYNSDLANNLGNLLSRVATVVGSKCDGIGPAPQPNSPLAAVAADVYSATAEAWGRVAPSEALEAAWRLILETNAYLEANEPWKAEADRPSRRCPWLRTIGAADRPILAAPAIPTPVAEICGASAVGSPTRAASRSAAWSGTRRLAWKGPPLFPRRVDDSHVT